MPYDERAWLHDQREQLAGDHDRDGRELRDWELKDQFKISDKTKSTLVLRGRSGIVSIVKQEKANETRS